MNALHPLARSLSLLGAALLLAAAPTLHAQRVLPADTIRLSLDEALGRAASLGEEVKLARTTVDFAGTQVKSARSAVFPTLDGSFNYTRTYASPFQVKSSATADTANPIAKLFGNLPFGRVNQYTANLTATQTLFSPRLGIAMRVANQFASATQFNLKEQMAEAEFQIRSAYVGALLAHELEASALEAVAQAQRFLESEKLRLSAGAGSELDVLRAEVAAENLRPQLVDAQNAASTSLLNLKRLINVPLSAPLALTTPLVAPAAASVTIIEPSTVVADRSAVHAEEQQVRIAGEVVKGAYSAYLPSVDLRMSLGRLLYPQEVFALKGTGWLTDWNAAVTLKLPLFNGFKRGAELSQAKIGLQQEQFRLSQLREAVQLQYQQAFGERERAAASITARQRTVDQAQRVYDLTGLRYDQGMASQLEVTDARLSLLMARANRAQAIAQYYIADASVQRARGASSSALSQAR